MESIFLDRFKKIIDNLYKNIATKDLVKREKDILDSFQREYIEKHARSSITLDHIETCRHWIDYALKHNTMKMDTYVALESIIDAKAREIMHGPRNIVVLPHLNKRLERIRKNGIKEIMD